MADIRDNMRATELGVHRILKWVGEVQEEDHICIDGRWKDMVMKDMRERQLDVSVTNDLKSGNTVPRTPQLGQGDDKEEHTLKQYS